MERFLCYRWQHSFSLLTLDPLPSSTSLARSFSSQQRAFSTSNPHLHITENLTMPPRTRALRPLLENPIVMVILWCMHCLRTALAEWDPASNDWPIQIECVRDAKASVMCRQCSSRNSPCIPVGFAKSLLKSETDGCRLRLPWWGMATT
jgi:hypothetical protein